MRSRHGFCPHRWPEVLTAGAVQRPVVSFS
nr:MAG TPA: hypothetical protein [Caudoviricetes sp.]